MVFDIDNGDIDDVEQYEQPDETGLDNEQRVGSSSQRGFVGGRAGEEAVYRTAGESNTEGSDETIRSVEEREELEERGLNPDWSKAKASRPFRSGDSGSDG